MTAAQRTRARTGPYDHANAELRQALHEWADARARQKQVLAHTTRTCAGCGGELEHTTRGCKRCFDRKSQREKRAAEAGRLAVYRGTPNEGATRASRR